MKDHGLFGEIGKTSAPPTPTRVSFNGLLEPRKEGARRAVVEELALGGFGRREASCAPFTLNCVSNTLQPSRDPSTGWYAGARVPASIRRGVAWRARSDRQAGRRQGTTALPPVSYPARTRCRTHTLQLGSRCGVAQVVVRINSLGSQWGREDLLAIAASPTLPDAILLPKVESAACEDAPQPPVNPLEVPCKLLVTCKVCEPQDPPRIFITLNCDWGVSRLGLRLHDFRVLCAKRTLSYFTVFLAENLQKIRGF